jgi:hypothetical protein
MKELIDNDFVKKLKIKNLTKSVIKKILNSKDFTFKLNEQNMEVVFNGSSLEFYKNKLLHREDGPAIEYTTGCKVWYQNGVRHREDGPAVMYRNNHKEWWVNGKLHRKDGPAIERSSGVKEWWFNGLRHREDGGATIEIPK